MLSSVPYRLHSCYSDINEFPRAFFFFCYLCGFPCHNLHFSHSDHPSYLRLDSWNSAHVSLCMSASGSINNWMTVRIFTKSYYMGMPAQAPSPFLSGHPCGFLKIPLALGSSLTPQWLLLLRYLFNCSTSSPLDHPVPSCSHSLSLPLILLEKNHSDWGNTDPEKQIWYLFAYMWILAEK